MASKSKSSRISYAVSDTAVILAPVKFKQETVISVHGKEGVVFEYTKDEFVEKLRSFYNKYISYTNIPVVRKAILGLVKSRDFLGFQLDHALGNISEKDFKEYVKSFLTEKTKYNADDLDEEIKDLLRIVEQPLDADVLSEVFNCEIEEAEKALARILQEHEDGVFLDGGLDAG